MLVKAGLCLGLLGLLLGPAVVVLGVGTLLNPAAQASCLPLASGAVGGLQVPESLTVKLRDGTSATLTRTQLERAATIITTGARIDGVNDDAIVIALMAALTESMLRMLSNATAYPASTGYPNDGDGSDHDSLGLFQMRPSTGWGTVHQLMDADYQVRAFYGGPTGPNHGSPRGLLDIRGWHQMDRGEVAQAVERSAYPERYASTETAAEAILAALTNTSGTINPRSQDGERRADREAGQSGTGRHLGQMPSINATAGGSVTGSLTTVNANLKYPKTTRTALRTIKKATAPDFVTLNEIHRFSSEDLERTLTGYGAYKDQVAIAGGSPAQSLKSAIMWRRDTWRMVDGGRVKIVEDDQTFFRDKRVRWDRYAIWGIFERRSDGVIVPIIATHHMTNVKKVSRQWGNPPLTRKEQYDLGMDILIQLAAVLSRYGPVLIGGDMNSHAGDGPFAAVPRMGTAGFSHTKGKGVMYQFFPQQVRVAGHRQLAVPSDHPANVTTLAMNGAGPGASPDATGGSLGEPSAGCTPCPTALGLTPLPGAPPVTKPGSYNLGPVSPALERLVEILAPMFGIEVVGGYRESARDPDGHPSGNAADFMLPATQSGWATPEGRRTGDALAAYAQAHAEELRIDYIIWWQRIWSVERADEGWRAMESRGSPVQDHREHVHVNTLPDSGPGSGVSPQANC